MRKLLLALGCALLFAAAPARADPATTQLEGRFTDLSTGKAPVTLTLPSPWDKISVALTDPTGYTRLADIQPDDILRGEFRLDANNKPTELTKIDQLRRPVGVAPRLIALGLAFAGILLFGGAVTGWKPQNFLIGLDNRYSNSQCQLAVWFAAVSAMYAATIGLRVVFLGWDYVGGVGMPANLITLTGLSAFSFGGAKVITGQKVADAAAAGLPPAKSIAAKSNILRDLIMSDTNRADLGDLQMITVALVAVAIFLVTGFGQLGELEIARQVMLPDVDSTLLASFGIGQGAYLAKKAAMKAGDG